MKNALIRLMVRGLLYVADRLPARGLEGLGALSGRVARRWLPRAAETARRRTEACLPESDARDVARRCFSNAGRNLAACVLLRRPGVRASDHVTVPDSSLDVLRRALEGGRGAIVVSAHLGPFEMIAARVAELGARPAVVVRESYDPGLDRVVDAHRAARGVEVIHRGKPGAGVRILRALREGRPVGVLPDLGGRRLASIPTRFLGETIAFPVGPQKIAQRTGSALLIGTLSRTRHGRAAFELRFEPVESSGTLTEVTQRVADGLSRAVSHTPADWLWMAKPHVAIAVDSGPSLFSSIIRHSE